MSVDNKVPEIRFKGFSEAWEEKGLGTDVAEIIGGGTPSTSISEFWDGDIDWYSPTEIGSNVYAEGSQKKITVLGLKSSSAKILPAGTTVLFTSRAGIGDMAILAKPGATNQGFQSFVVKEGFSPYFLYSAGKQIKEFALKHASGSTFLEISGKQLGRMKILMPCSEEQTTIGNYFQKLDALINQHQQKHDKLSNIKKAMLEKMFPKQGETIPEIRFKGFSGEWEENVLSNEVEFFNGLTYSPSDIRKSGTLVLRSSNVKNGQLIDADDVYVNPEVVNCSNVIEGDIIVVVRNGSRNLIGKHAQVTTRMNNTVIGAFMTGIRSKQPAFINALLDTKMFTDEVERNLGATINQITNGSFKNMIFMFPKKDEQQKIGNHFHKLDALINQHQHQITKLNNIKQACLSKMFV
ncbi:restriction endonuclease subunit S [Salmonella enterica]|nr:restriction endonuclease subunit S [Salmonella enterica]EBS8343373.1 restriction endonuclease subunit S [Salmonella enterica]EBS8686579.1 restriction endonuclease subunit S [Salmonella enterica]EBS8686899.1 restriction endonuclease subunit S [Salmonella enterica]EBT3582682.1 restriction endonuclease subunit S [Salmonella enterica]